MTQQTMTKEQILEQVANDKSYSSWGECMYDTHEHSQIEYTCEAMELYAKHEVAKEREKAKKLVEALEEIADMTGNILIYKKAKQSLTEYEKL